MKTSRVMMASLWPVLRQERRGQATAGKRPGWQVGRRRPAVPELGRWAAAHASGNPKPHRGAMFIANDVHKNISQPHRGGMRLRRTIPAAPMGLGTIIGLDGCYKHGAPTELGLARLPWSGQSSRRPNQSLDRMTRSAVSQIGRHWRDPRHRSAWRYETGLKVRFKYCRLCSAMTAAPSSNLKTSTETKPL